MTASRRSILAAAGGGLASMEVAGRALAASPNSATAAVDSAVADLIQLSQDSNAALMRGDIRRYQALITLSEDFTLMSPFGGKPSRAISEAQMQAMGRFFSNGALEMEMVQAYGSADLVVLALIERAHVEVGGLPAQDWALRVTLVYRREGSEWRLAHRHADPLAPGVSLEEAAALARRKAA